METKNRKIWITGGGGFMGPHLADYLSNKGYEVLATYYPSEEKSKKINSKVKYEECDVRDKDRVYSILREFKPDKIFHLAAQSLPTFSWKDPWYTIETNIIGTINIFEGIKELKLDSKVLVACSSAEYGYVTPDEVPVKENHSLKPLHPYGVSKVSQEMLSYQYFKNFNIKTIPVRIFNTTGPGKTNDVCSDFTKRLIEIEKGINPTKKLKVGNLKSKRAITDVRDIIKAFDIALDSGEIGEVYNLSGEKVYEINEIVEILRKLVDFKFELETDKNLIRPTDEPIIFGDSKKFKDRTGWKQEIPLEKTLKDMILYWRETL
jgi:GDP-4-dehydro-6-deoxy-D-mannose reductase